VFIGIGLWWWRFGEYARIVHPIGMRGLSLRWKGFFGAVIEQHEAMVVASSDGVG
jgi:hypothetical protein